jgi:hypothetical protein
MTKEIPQPPPSLTAEERALVSQLSPQQLQAVDEALLAEVTERWRKVAMVVGLAIGRPSHIRGVPDTFYGQRMCALVQEGRVEAQGNVEYMRFSEVGRWPPERPNASRGA